MKETIVNYIKNHKGSCILFAVVLCIMFTGHIIMPWYRAHQEEERLKNFIIEDYTGIMGLIDSVKRAEGVSKVEIGDSLSVYEKDTH